MRSIAKAFLLLAAIGGCSVGGYVLWRDPRVRELFQSEPARQADPLAFLKEIPVSSPAPERPASSAGMARQQGRLTDSRAKARASSQQPPETDNELQIISDIPDEQVSRLVLQRLFTLRKHAGISVSVQKSVVHLYGVVASADDRKLIVDTVRKLPGVYKVDASELTVSPPVTITLPE